MKKRVLSFIVVLALIFTYTTYAVNININGNNVNFTEKSGVPFVDENNRMLVPLRATMEAFGATVNWLPEIKTATVEKDGIRVDVPIGKTHILKNFTFVETDTAAIVKDDRVYIPIRPVLEAFGTKVNWNNDSQAITASTLNNELELLKIHFIDVGQADCILIELPTNEEILIDAGNKGDNKTIINYIKNQGIDDIEYFILTHFHEDHIGSAPDILREFDVDKVYIPDTTANTQIYKDTIQAIEKENAEVIKAKGGTSIIDTANLDFEVLAPNSMWYSEMNEFSLVTKLVYGDTSFLFTGDAESVSELEMVRAGYDLDVDLLKVGHHGGETSTSKIFLDVVTPEYSIISVGEGNNYGRPNDKTLNRLSATGSKIYRTDELGTIIVESDGLNITIDKISTAYSPGQIKEEPTIIAPSENNNTSYIGNSNSLKFHYQSCSSVKSISVQNKVFFNSRVEAINQGYVPCKICNP